LAERISVGGSWRILSTVGGLEWVIGWGEDWSLIRQDMGVRDEMFEVEQCKVRAGEHKGN